VFLFNFSIPVSAAAASINRQGMQPPLGVADLERELGLQQRAQVTVDWHKSTLEVPWKICSLAVLVTAT